jgi:hypothetical protein
MESLRRDLHATPHLGAPGGTAERIAEELHVEALALQSEFDGIARRRGLLASGSLVAMGVALGIYGLGSGSIDGQLAGLGGFIAALSAAHQVESPAAAHRHALTYQPAYLLLAAKRQLHVLRRLPKIVTAYDSGLGAYRS